MNQDTALRYPKLDNEIIDVTDFLVIKKATMKCGDITVLVGKQATGKSLLAKLRYFFWDYQQDLMNFDSFVYEGIKKFKDIKEYNERKLKLFCELFPDIENSKNKFLVIFENDGISITIKKDSKIEIEISKKLKNLIKDAQEVLDSIQESSDDKSDSNDKFVIRRVNLIIRRRRLLRSRVAFNNVPSVLYVPASRLFFATVQGNIFRFMNSGEYSFDRLSKRFSGFWETHREDFSNSFKNPEQKESWFKTARDILAGKYVYKDRTDYIKNDWGRTVRLKDASSGQQEVLFLLAAINYFPNENKENKLLIIEEPEAHIYPTSQKLLIKMIADVAREKKCKVMITTHSPYIPACVNNEIIRAQNKNKPLTVSAYNLSERTVYDLYHEKQDLIDVDKLDEVSDEIVDEYFDLTEKQDSAKKGKGKSGD